MTDLEEQIRKLQEFLYSAMVEGSTQDHIPLTKQPIFIQHGVMKIAQRIMLKEIEILIKEFRLVQEQGPRTYEFELIGRKISFYQNLRTELIQLM